jgi:hypothetical protein
LPPAAVTSFSTASRRLVFGFLAMASMAFGVYAEGAHTAKNTDNSHQQGAKTYRKFRLATMASHKAREAPPIKEPGVPFRDGHVKQRQFLRVSYEHTNGDVKWTGTTRGTLGQANACAERLFRPRRYFEDCAKRLTDLCSPQPCAD